MDYKKHFNALNYCIIYFGSIIIISPIVFFLFVIMDDTINVKLPAIVNFYTNTVIQSTLVGVPFFIIFSLWASYLNLQIKDKLLYFGAISFSGLLLLIIIYLIPIRVSVESLINNENMKIIYGIVTFIAPYTIKRPIFSNNKE